MTNRDNRTDRRTRANRGRRLLSAVESLENRIVMDATYHSLAGGQFAQDWTNIGLITADDNWNNVPSIVGFRGDGLTGPTGTNPQGILTSGTAPVVDVIANQNQAYLDTAAASGGVSEIEIANPTIALNGSGTADAPYVQLHVNTTSVPSVDVAYDLRDLDSLDSTNMQVALQFRTNPTGNWTDVPAGYVADASGTGATVVTPVNVTLPAEAGNAPQLQVRIITTNAPGNDEAIGVDNLIVKATPVVQPPGSFNLAGAVRVNEGAGIATVTVNRNGGAGGAATVDYATSNDTAIAGTDYTATSGTLAFADGQTSATFDVPLTNDTTDELANRLNVSLSNATVASLGSNTTTTVTIVDNDGAALAAGPFLQDWTDTNLITTSGNFDGVLNVVGYSNDANREAGVANVAANVTDPAFNTGGVTEFELENPTIGVAGAGSGASVPQIVIDVNTQSVSATAVSFNARDLDPSADDAVQPIRVSYRVGGTGEFIEILNNPDVTVGGGTASTALSVLLPAEALGQQLVQVRVSTVDAVGNDEAIGIDDIRIGTPVVAPGVLAFASSVARVNEGAGTATVTVTRNGGSSGAVSVDYATTDGTAVAGIDYTATTGTLSFADGVATQDIVVPISSDLADELGELFSISLGNPQGGATLGTVVTTNVTIADDDGHLLSGGSLSQDWSNVDLITVNDNWNNVPNITGYGNDADVDAGPVDVLANQANANISNGGVVEFDGIENPSVALQGSNAATAPQLVLDLNTTNVSAGNLAFNIRDLDATIDNAAQPVSVSYRVGNSGDFLELFLVEDATTGPSLADLVTPVSVALPSEAIGQQLVQFRISTSNVGGNDEFVAIDDVVLSGTAINNPGTLALSAPTYTVNEEAGTVTIAVNRTGGTAGTVTVDYATTAGSASAGSDFVAASGTLTFLDGATTASFDVAIANDVAPEPSETFTVALSSVTGGALLGSPASATVTITDTDVVAATVVGRQIFYNRSAFDGNNLAANAADDGAIATDKSALLPGGTATFANYTSYSRGINGVIVDVASSPNPAGLTASDFTFRVGNVNDTAGWTTAPAPASVTIREGAGVNGSDRVTIIWADNAIQKQWLQVTTLATANTGLAAADVFYFGNAIGESGNTTANAAVTSVDEIGARNNPRNALGSPAPINFAFDYNRDRSVNAADQILARNNGTNPLTNALRLITPTAPAPAPLASTFEVSRVAQSLFSDSEILA